MTKTIAIIPARGGSKRIPRKNIKEFCGKPIIQYSIDVALQSGVMDEVMVSTDDDEIAEIAQKCGANVPFMRSKKNADDYATTIDVLREVLDEYEKIERKFDYVCCIYPTAPLIRSEWIRKAKELLEKTPETESVVPVLKYPVPIEWAMKIDNGFLMPEHPEKQLLRSQDLLPRYYDSGQFYFTTTKFIQKNDNLINEHTIPIFLNDTEAQDIDNEEDWQMAELKYCFINREQIKK